MATELNKIYCGTDAKNTGICDCFLDPKLITGAILIPKSRVLTAAEILVIQATLEGLVETTKANRIFPIQGFVAITDNSEDPTNQTFGYGSLEPVREGSYNWIFQYRKGGVNLSNSLRSFNGLTAKYSVIFIENQNILLGTKKDDATGATGMAGIPLEVLYNFPWKANDGSNLAQYRIQFGFRPEYINENIAFVKVATTDYLLSELVGLEDINLTVGVADLSDDTVLVTATTDCGSTNFYDLFADEMEEVTAWNVTTAAGVPIAVTPTKVPASKGWLLTYDSAEIAVGDKISFAAPSVLSAAPINVSGYESDIVAIATSQA